MKKIFLTALLVPAMALAQTFPTPTFNSLTLVNPLTAANGGTGATASTGTGSVVLSNSPTLTAPALGTPSAVTLTNGTGLPVSTGISGLGTGVAAGLANAVTGSGSPVLATSPSIANPTVTGAFTATGLVTLADHATQAANTVLANVTGSTASPAAFAMPGCSSSTSALQYASGTGFTCSTSINAATLGGATFAAPGPIGSTAASTGSFTTLAASGTVSGAGFTSLLSPYATTALVAKELGNTSGMTGIGSATTLTNANAGNVVTIGAGVPVTLPLASTMPAGGTITFASSANGASLLPQGTDKINVELNNLTRLALNAGDQVTLTTNTVTWYATTHTHKTCQNILDFGGDNSGTSDNVSAFNATVAAAGLTGQACVYFPPGTYAFAGPISYTMPSNSASITLQGAGQDVTNLVWPASSSGLQIYYVSYNNSATVSDMSFVTQGAGGGTVGLTLNQAGTAGTVPAESLVKSVVFRGFDGYQVTNCWGTGLLVAGVSNVNVISGGFWGASAFNGNGIHYVGSGSIFPVQENIVGAVFSGLVSGVVYDTNTQGLSVSASNFTNVSNGILVPAGISGTSQLTVTGSQFNCTSVCVYEQTGVDSTIITGNLFFIGQGANGIFLSPASSSLISANAFVPRSSGETANAGVTFSGWKAFSSVVTGNQCSGLITCINLATGSKFVNVQSNAYSGNTNNVINSGTGNTVGGGSP